MASLLDVAQAAGVSVTTASRALSGRGRVAEATRARVRSAAAALGFVASATASSLASGRAENIGVVVPLMDRWFFATVLDGIASRLAPRGYDLTLYNITDDADQRRGVFTTSLRRGRVDGLIVLSLALRDEEVAALDALGIPVIGLGVPRPDITGPRVDDTAVGRIATEHLLGLGHRDIAFVGHTAAPAPGTDPDLDIPTRRRHGFEQALADAGIRHPRTAAADFTVEGARAAAHRLLSAPPAPTAVFAASDEMAYGVIAAAGERGLSVPGDLSVIGVDGHDLAAVFDLTTIDQRPHGQGEQAAEAVLAALGVGGSAPAAPSLPFELVIRGSTAPPPPNPPRAPAQTLSKSH